MILFYGKSSNIGGWGGRGAGKHSLIGQGEKVQLVTRTIDFTGKYVIRKKHCIVWDTCS